MALAVRRTRRPKGPSDLMIEALAMCIADSGSREVGSETTYTDWGGVGRVAADGRASLWIARNYNVSHSTISRLEA
jgi:hypothetical protein